MGEDYFPEGDNYTLREGVKCWVEGQVTYMLFRDGRKFKQIQSGKTITIINLDTKQKHIFYRKPRLSSL
jgi:hypothetical protein